MSKITSREPLGDFRGIKATIINHEVWEHPANTLELRLPEPRNVLCAYQGYRKVSAVLNCYHPKESWHAVDNTKRTYENYTRWVHREMLRQIVPGERVALLFTGVDMHKHVMVEETYEEQWVQAWVTAGVRTNAIRVGRDSAFGIERDGLWQPFGTINIIVLTSADLGQAAMASSFITITEAKTAALQDLNIRSSYNPDWQATGTSTDQICVIPGKGGRCFYVSGQVKLGELMARAVTKGVTKAINKVISEC
ncbi:MAG: adenosylcobinamide amidohydrolase [Dehalogenimonas sp.]